MNINKIDSSKNPNFNALLSIKCSIGGRPSKCSYDAKMIAEQLRKKALIDKFFVNYDVNAVIDLYYGKTSLKLDYKPVANGILEKIKRHFEPAQTIELLEKYNCTLDGAFHLAKRVRDMGSFEKLVLNIDKSNLLK